VASIPSGTVTLLFTDVQGSTRLWEAEPDAMAVALRRHDDIIRYAVAAHGYVFKTVGDQFCIAFETPRQAVDAALSAQLALTHAEWPTTRPIKVRMGLHTGETEERDGDYFGPVVNRVARLEAAAHGGQVLLSGATAELIRDALPEEATLTDMGQHRLKDLGRPEHVFQLTVPGLPEEFPPLASLDSPELPNNLPGQLSTFIGRATELKTLRDLLRHNRLVTLTGPGGCGKTRLALQAAAEQVGRVPDGTWFADLASITDGAQVPAAVAAALGLRERDEQALLGTLKDHDTLIILDNCEQVVDAAAKFSAQILRECHAVRILATSREPLGIDGEQLYRVAPLSLPTDGDDAEKSEAVQLFTDRARAKDPTFTLDATTAPLVATICRRLDGIPLALELAAARLPALALPQLVQRLDQRFRLLTGGSRSAMPRQQTLQAAVDWSYSLLHDTERETMRRLSVCVRGFDLEAAAAITAQDEFEVLDLLTSLVTKSLVNTEPANGTVRYWMLETIRQYCAQDLLQAEGEDGVLAAQTRHAEYYLRLAETAESHTRGPNQARWLRRLDSDWPNLRTALARFQADGRVQDILRLGVALDRFAMTRGQVEIADALRTALDQLGESAPPTRLLVRALVTLFFLVENTQRRHLDRYRVGRATAERAIALARQLGDPELEAMTLEMLATQAFREQDVEAVRENCAAALEISRRIGDLSLTAMLLTTKQAAAQSIGEKREICLEALDFARRAGDTLVVLSVESLLFGLDIRVGDLPGARRHLDEGYAIATDLGADLLLYYLQYELFILLIHDEDYARTAAMLRQNLLMAHRLGMGLTMAGGLFAAACCAAWKGDVQTAARLHGAADAEFRTAVINKVFSWTDFELHVHAREQAKLRVTMGDVEFAALYRVGTKLSLDQALDLALGRTRLIRVDQRPDLVLAQREQQCRQPRAGFRADQQPVQQLEPGPLRHLQLRGRRRIDRHPGD
jgi:predicted ATPase/class 3 adenylate cyclase